MGDRHIGIIDNVGHLWMMGSNYYGQLGTGSRGEAFEHEPINITKSFDLKKGETIVDLALGVENTIALTSHNRLFVWGSNDLGQLGNGSTSTYGSNKPVDISIAFTLNSGEQIIQLMANTAWDFPDTIINNSTLGFLTNYGRLFLWGSTIWGVKFESLGTGRNQRFYRYFNEPTQVNHRIPLDDDEYIIKVDLGEDYASENHQAFLTNKGRLWMSGDNFYHQIYNEDLIELEYINGVVDVSVTIPLNQNEKIVDVSLGARQTGVMTSTGRIFLWGSNDEGTLGTSNSNLVDFLDNSLQPILLNQTYKRIELSGGNAYGIKADNTLFAWGDNEYAQLGTNETIGYSVLPKRVSNLDTILQFSGGNLNNGVIDSNNQLWMWGSMGDGITHRRPTQYFLD
jgi:alpha-tubulin suppressor-like RCC1 family protein